MTARSGVVFMRFNTSRNASASGLQWGVMESTPKICRSWKYRRSPSVSKTRRPYALDRSWRYKVQFPQRGARVCFSSGRRHQIFCLGPRRDVVIDQMSTSKPFSPCSDVVNPFTVEFTSQTTHLERFASFYVLKDAEPNIYGQSRNFEPVNPHLRIQRILDIKINVLIGLSLFWLPLLKDQEHLDSILIPSLFNQSSKCHHKNLPFTFTFY